MSPSNTVISSAACCALCLALAVSACADGDTSPPGTTGPGAGGGAATTGATSSSGVATGGAGGADLPPVCAVPSGELDAEPYCGPEHEPLDDLVRDRRGRFVSGLAKKDFEVIDGGHFRPLVDLQFDANAPIRVALLFDVSGSMSVSSKLASAVAAARHFMHGMTPADEAAVFAFDRSLREVQGFTADRDALDRAFSGLTAFGQTSIFDAAAARVLRR